MTLYVVPVVYVYVNMQKYIPYWLCAGVVLESMYLQVMYCIYVDTMQKGFQKALSGQV
jgi:hypothetical protein